MFTPFFRKQLKKMFTCNSHVFRKRFRTKTYIVTLREAKRCNAGVPVAKCEAAGGTQSVQEMTTWCKSFNCESPTATKTHPNLPQTLPKLIQNRSKRPLGAHVGPMLYKSSGLKARKNAQRRPRVSKRGPKPPKMDSKTIQKTSWSPSWTHVFKRYELERPTVPPTLGSAQKW